jgi:hypothetical protein
VFDLSTGDERQREQTATKKEEPVATERDIDQAVSKALGPRLNLKPANSSSWAHKLVGKMTGGSRDMQPADSRDGYGRVVPDEDKATKSQGVERDFFGRRINN